MLGVSLKGEPMMEAIRCPSCGGPMAQDALTCEYCGTSYVGDLESSACMDETVATVITELLPTLMLMGFVLGCYGVICHALGISKPEDELLLEQETAKDGSLSYLRRILR